MIQHFKCLKQLAFVDQIMMSLDVSEILVYMYCFQERPEYFPDVFESWTVEDKEG